MNVRQFSRYLPLGFAVFCSASPAAEWKADAAGHAAVVRPFLEKHCARCHDAEKEKGDFRVDTMLPNNFADAAAVEKWKEVVNVLNGHDMPPKKEPQPQPAELAAMVDWVTQQLVAADLGKRDGAVVLRRLNREEYRNTVFDLTGVWPEVSQFPADPASGGFDNNGKALTISPLHMELYMDSAAKVLDKALREGERPPTIHWQFESELGEGDNHRVRLDKQNNAISHGGKNEKRGGMTVMHHEQWDRHLNARDFRVPVAGVYRVRLRGGSYVPKREAVVAKMRELLEKRIADSKNPKEAKWQREHFDQDLAHFQKDGMYDYGPARLKLIRDLGGQPEVVAEFDLPGTPESPQEVEFLVPFTEAKAGLTWEYAYSIPNVLENAQFQRKDDFPRPEAHVDWFSIEGPVEPVWPPTSRSLVLGNPLPDETEELAVKRTLRLFLTRAFRRQVEPAEVEAKFSLYKAARASGEGMISSVKAPLIASLSSPHFLYLTEPAKQGRALSAYELASRLSYFLWSTMPDAPLLAAAENGSLNKPDGLQKQVDRLLADSKVDRFVQNFADQWLGLREVGSNPPAAELYPQYDRHLELSIVGESRAFFKHLLQRDLPVVNFLKSDFVTINERLARFYGISGVRGDEFREVKVPAGVNRGGVLSQASVLSITSNGTRTSPVKRGTWVLKNLLDRDPGLPVANVGDIKPKVPGIDKATVRQRLSIHRELAQCARCHDKIDPLGLALENFNAAGEWRDREGFGYKGRIEKSDPPIDASAVLPDGQSFSGVAGLQDYLVANQADFNRCLTQKLLTYALGRELGYGDRPDVAKVLESAQAKGLTLRALISSIVQSDAFRRK